MATESLGKGCLSTDKPGEELLRDLKRILMDQCHQPYG
jgi:hypothetical protein